MRPWFRTARALGLAVSLIGFGCGDDETRNVNDNTDDTGKENIIQGSITGNVTLRAVDTNLLRGAVFVTEGATLTIEPGTTVYAEGATLGTLVVARGGKIIAEGTADKPIVFTSDKPAGSRARGQWGGLIINGKAPINAGAEVLGEGDTGAYGGTNPADSSGSLRYVRVEFAGIEFSPDNELNGIAFQGVGNGTTVEYVQVHFNQDDGVEFFGGTVNAKHILVTAARDDSFDWTDGWSGKGQFWIAQQRGDDADNGFEVDNSKKNNDALPRSNAQVYNVTLIGDPKGPESATGMLLREGTAGIFRNIICMGFNKAGLDINNKTTHALAKSGDLSVQNTILWGNKKTYADPADGFDEKAWATTPAFNIVEVDPKLNDPYNLTVPDFRPSADSPAVSGKVPVAKPPADGFFSPVTFIGGIGPNENWTSGWTTTAQN
jgi:hypothetical protein